MPPAKPNPELTKTEERQLLDSTEVEWVALFPNHSNQWLRRAKRLLKESLPLVERVQSETNAQALRRRMLELENQNERLKTELDQLYHLDSVKKSLPVEVRPASDGREATAVAIASDWHCEEPVDPEQMNGLNEFNLDVYRERAQCFFANLVRLVKKERRDIAINNLVLALLGDFFSNTIHDDLAESNLLGPADAAELTKQTILGGIRHIRKKLPDVKLTVVCHSGNHGRMTQKTRIQTERQNSLEWFLYKSLSQIVDDPMVDWIIPAGYHSYVDIHGTVVRFHHGHMIRFGGGVGGITVPVNKAIAQWNKARKADLDCFGHFHQFFDGGNFICNGSLIGYNDFAVAIRAGYEPPRQAFFLIDSKHGKTVVAPILLEAA